jgi:hypothetical protein
MTPSCGSRPGLYAESMGDREHWLEMHRGLLRARQSRYDRPCELCGKPVGRPRAAMHRHCRKRAERRWAADLPANAYPGKSGWRGRLALDQLTKEEARALEFEQESERVLARVRAEAHEAGRQDGIKETLELFAPFLRGRLEELDAAARARQRKQG